MSGYFSATETAFSSLNRIRVKNMAEKGNKKAELVLHLLEDYNSILSTILIGNNIVNILGASLATVFFVRLLNEDVGPSVATIVSTIVVLIFGEISPKTLAKERPEKFAMFSAPVLRVLKTILTPINFIFGLWKKLLSIIFKSDEDRSITEEELLTIVEEAEQEGGIDEEESNLIRSAIEFSEVEAIDILTPRIDITGIPMDATKEEIAKVFAETGYSRIPIYEDNLDHIEGIIYQKDFHNYVYNTDREVASIIRPVHYITKNKNIDELLKELQKEKSHFAVVVDEYGGTAGIVTLEDIIEELVGEIWDEHDEVTQDIVQNSESEYLILGSANIEEVLDMLDIDMDEELDVLTVSGWVMDQLQKIPEEGDSFTYENLTVKVLKMDERRVDEVLITVKEDAKEDE
jgi:CBS domain containing-hemolysin-like protein